jgi:hypothetical protein
MGERLSRRPDPPHPIIQFLQILGCCCSAQVDDDDDASLSVPLLKQTPQTPAMPQARAQQEGPPQPPQGAPPPPKGAPPPPKGKGPPPPKGGQKPQLASFTELLKVAPPKQTGLEGRVEQAKPLNVDDLKNPSADIFALHATYRQYKANTFTDMDAGAQQALITSFRKSALVDESCVKLLSGNQDFVTELLLDADVDTLESIPYNQLGNVKAPVVGKALARFYGSPEDDRTLTPKLAKLEQHITTKEWNDPANGLAARAFNALWNAGRYDKACELIGQGLDTAQPCQDKTQKGRAAGNDEGVWSGFVQPISHLLGNYLRPCAVEEGLQSDQRSEKIDGKRLDKILGAKKLLDKMGEKPDAHCILTSYQRVQASPMVKQFGEKPGTIWGFEDVRLPYVQAGREASRDRGQRPIRMMEIWEAVSPILGDVDYKRILNDPDTLINEFVEAGVKKIEEGKRAGDEKYRDYTNDAQDFIPNFKKQAASFLTHLVDQLPTGKLDVATAAGIEPGKMMGAFACKAGIWWAKDAPENKEPDPIYYCLDGINITDVINYKSFRRKQISAYLTDATGKEAPHQEVITMTEVREILKHLPDMGHVKFYLKGTEVPSGTVKEWSDQLKKADEAGGERPAPPKSKFERQLHDLGLKDDVIVELTDYQAMKIVEKSGLLTRAANTRPALLARYLMGKCDLLFGCGILPANLGLDCSIYLDLVAEKAEAQKLNEMGIKLRNRIAKVPADSIKTALLKALKLS